MKTNYLKKYIISSYVLVWLLIIFVAGTASLVFHAPPVIMWIVRILYVFLDVGIGFFAILTVLYLIITPVAILIKKKSDELKSRTKAE